MICPTEYISIPHDQFQTMNKHKNESSNCSYDPPVRQRINSADIPSTYSGLYGEGGKDGDLLPFELTRNPHKVWISSLGIFLSIIYMFFIFAIQIVFMAFLNYKFTWTATNVIHSLITIIYLHWLKGSPDFYGQGEMNGMTLWEQLTSTPDTDTLYEFHKKLLLITPAFLSYAGCHFAEYNRSLFAVNVILWIICTGAKTRFMHGVRLLGINCTVGIDDYNRKFL